MAELDREHESHRMGMHTEQLAGRSQQIYFTPEEGAGFTYPDALEVDFNKRSEFDAADLAPKDVMAAKPMVLHESDEIIVLASEEVAIRSVFPHEIDTFDPYEGEVRVWKN